MPIRLNHTTRVILSEFWVNIAAGWFGVGIIVPLTGGASLTDNLGMLTVDTLFGIFSLIIAYKLRQRNRKR